MARLPVRARAAPAHYRGGRVASAGIAGVRVTTGGKPDASGGHGNALGGSDAGGAAESGDGALPSAGVGAAERLCGFASNSLGPQSGIRFDSRGLPEKDARTDGGDSGQRWDAEYPQRIIALGRCGKIGVKS